MGYKINKIFLLIFLILLQSCSGGRIGNFLESSFKNIEESKIDEGIKKNFKNKVVINSGENLKKYKNIEESKIDEGIKKNFKNKAVIKSGENVEKYKNIEESKIDEEIKNSLKNKIQINSDKKTKNNKKITEKKISSRKKQYQPQTYKIIFILRDVDPKDPTENLRNILINSDVNFEIEKIQRFVDTNNKSIKKTNN